MKMKELLKRVIGLKERARLTEVFNKKTSRSCCAGANSMLHM